ncbi:hypothetical protein BMF94_1400 [Rhodotorula taiwanensis]|uniref:Uncharacterized protein n=1 Tax=Rhodotorula taiwanensis TaxID=741276 RepID=A0A2S5BFE7_9BASI|nr:hypothetical protein BMF94_1400 [Rhodotorula taiwanensis]
MRSAVLPILSPASTSGANNARVAHNVPIIVRRHFVELLTLSTLVAALVYFAIRKLHGKPRTGVGLAVERACGERHESLTPWLDALHGLEEKCPQLDADERAQIVANAKRQCGSWCLWDLDRNVKVGWHLSGDCFQPFSSPHECDQWWYQRPGLEGAVSSSDGSAPIQVDAGGSERLAEGEA